MGASAALAWSKAKQFANLEKTYAGAEKDLGELIAQAEQSDGPSDPETELSRLVDEVEEFLSREHQLWVARRITDAPESEAPDDSPRSQTA